jgi:hypothetical protein
LKIFKFIVEINIQPVFVYELWNVLLFVFSSLLLRGIVLLFLAILDVTGSLDHIVGSMIFITFAVPKNIMNAITDTNPILLNFIAFSILLFKLKKHAIEKKITIITAIDTKTERLGNSEGEKEDIVSKIRNPPIIVESRVTRVLISKCLLNLIYLLQYNRNMFIRLKDIF